MEWNDCKTWYGIYVVAVFALLLSSGCIKDRAIKTDPGTPTGDEVTAVIGAAGGELAAADGRLKISVPAGAVASDTTFSIQPISCALPSSIGSGFRLEPHGVNFVQPVSLTFTIPEAGVSRTSLPGIGIAFQNDDGYWEWIKNAVRNEDNGTLTVLAQHFSDHAAIEGLTISPGHASVDEGESVRLQVKLCAAAGTSQGDLANLVCTCQPVTGVDFDFQDWAVNGTAGGDGTYGTIDGSHATATYTAPSQKPEPNKVRVSVSAQATQWSWDGTASTEKSLLFSYITIGPSTYKGTFTVESKMGTFFPWTGEGEATWTPVDPENNNGEYTVTGTITPDQTEYVFPDMICVLNGNSRNFEGIGEIRETPPGQYWTIGTTIWSATCTNDDGSYQAENFLSILWAASCLSNNEWAPVDDPAHLTGSYTWAGCTPFPIPYAPSSTVTWDFQEQ